MHHVHVAVVRSIKNVVVRHNRLYKDGIIYYKMYIVYPIFINTVVTSTKSKKTVANGSVLV